MKPLKIAFAGTPEFAAVALDALIHSSHEVTAVYTQPDRPSGRGLKLTPSAVKLLAQQYQLPIYQPASLKNEHEQGILAQLNPDVLVVAAYGLLLPSAVLHIPRLGCINIHPSLLPRWRGAAPIQRTLYAGDIITGVTIMRMDEGLDTGPLLLQKQYVVDPDETSQTLHDKLASIGAHALIEALDLLSENALPETPQDNHKATYANKISKEEALIDWELPAQTLENQIRAFNPWPVSHTSWKEQSLRIWKAKALPEMHRAEPRTLLHASKDGIDVATGDGVLRLLTLQLPGGKPLSAADFFNARQHDLTIGAHFI